LIRNVTASTCSHPKANIAHSSPRATGDSTDHTTGISEKTVRNHLSHLFDKLGVWSRAQAIVFARERGFVREPREPGGDG
jgi:hypothetical protein